MDIVNPVLPGFHPDPSICRVGDDYYIATSTFQWFPGVRIHHSRDMVHWKPVGYALDRKSQLDMIGVEDNAGIWAPCLSHCDGLFYLIYTIMRTWTASYKDCHNFLVTAERIEGPWSEPIYLNSSGFDPSLFHDDDGKKWLVNMVWDHRFEHNPFAGILLQQYLPQEKRLAGHIQNIFQGTDLGLVEGPHLYKKDGWYYLLTAEGGTGWDHACSIARSKSIAGPYEVAPRNPICTSRDDATLALQRAGHGSFVETQNGEWYLAHLCGRPVMPMRRCTLGRETALQKLHWEPGGWPRLITGGNAPASTTPAPELEPHPFDVDAKSGTFFDDFDGQVLDSELNALRVPIDESWLTLKARPGYLRLYGRESLYSKHQQSLVARRITGFEVTASCSLQFSPHSFQQMAGLIFYYDTTNHHYLRVSQNEYGICLGIITCEGGNQLEYPDAEIPLEEASLELKGEMSYDTLQFFYRQGENPWQAIGPQLDATVLSDEYKCDVKFTGAFVGVCVQDLTGQRLHADFDWFRYEAQTE